MENKKIYAKLQNIQGKFTEILKDNANKFQNYKYFTEYQALTFLKPLLDNQKLTLTFADLPELDHSAEKVEKNWTLKYWKEAILTNSEKTDEQLSFRFWALGENSDLAKAKGAAETYAIKYFLTKFFLIPVTDKDDPDKEQWKTSSVPELNKEEKVVIEEFFEKHK